MAEPCPPHVLFVDDDPATLDVAQRALEHFGFRVTTHDAPDLDPDAVVRLAPDMVALDYWYGRQPLAVPFLERLRSHPTTAHLPVLLVSAATLAVARDRTVIDPLVDAVLAKPYGIFELRDAVEGCLRARAGGAGRSGAAVLIADCRSLAERGAFGSPARAGEPKAPARYRVFPG